MRILLVTPYFKPAHLGGIERAIERLAEALGHQPAVDWCGLLATRYAFPPRYVAGLPAHEHYAEGFDVLRLSSRPHTPAPLFPYYSCPVTYFSTGQLKHILDQVRPDVVHFVGDGWLWAHLAVLARRAPETAVVFTPSFHDLAGSRRWFRWPNTLVCRQAERTVVLTKHEWRGVAEAYRPRRDHLALIPWGTTIPDTVAAEHPAENPLTLLCVGRLGVHKGQAWLLDVYAAARAHFARPTRLVLVGADEGDSGGHEALKERIAALALQDEVVLTGEVDDAALEDWYQAADLFALFSHYEAFGLVYIEAMAHGLPVLTHDVGAVAEVLTQGAVIVPRYDQEAAERELIRLVTGNESRHDLGRQARLLATATYSWDAVAARYRQVYEEAIDERRSPTGATA